MFSTDLLQHIPIDIFSRFFFSLSLNYYSKMLRRSCNNMSSFHIFPELLVTNGMEASRTPDRHWKWNVQVHFTIFLDLKSHWAQNRRFGNILQTWVTWQLHQWSVKSVSQQMLRESSHQSASPTSRNNDLTSNMDAKSKMYLWRAPFSRISLPWRSGWHCG